MSDLSSHNLAFTTAVSNLIALTQKGQLNWEHGNGQGQYFAYLDGKEFRLTTREGILYELTNPIGVTDWSWSNSTATSNFSKVRLDVYSGGNLELRFPPVPVLSSLAIAVENFVGNKAVGIFDVINKALKDTE